MLKRTLFLWSSAAAGAVAFGVAVNCGGGGSSAGPDNAPPTATQSQFLQAAGQCAVGVYAGFAQAAEALAAACDAHAADPSAANRDAARRAWEGAIDLWQQAEVFQFGPAAAAPSPGGRGLRDGIYAWPLTSRCAVEQTLVSQAYANGDFATASLANARGLAALEYLLFYEGADNGCDATSAINAQGTWAAAAAELPARKAAYARVAAADLAQRARALADAWAPAKGNFAGEVATAGTGSATFPSGQAALNAINDALFYVEAEVKDDKLALPLALSNDPCPGAAAGEVCVAALESPYAGRSRRHVRNNLVGFRKLFLGCDDEAGAGVGFDDLLTGAGAGELATQMTTRLDAAFAAVDAVSDEAMTPGALSGQKASLTNVWRGVRDLVDQMKTQFLSTLDLELPQRVEGDND